MMDKFDEFEISIEHSDCFLDAEGNNEVPMGGAGQVPFLDFSFFPGEENTVDYDEEQELFAEVEKMCELQTQVGESMQAFTTANPHFELDEDTHSLGDATIGKSIFDEKSNEDTPSLVQTSNSKEWSSSAKTVKSTGLEIKPYQEEKWNLRFKEFLAFVRENGRGSVPNQYPKNQQLARWVKRQRRQYKLWTDGKPSTITKERFEILTSAGFIFDAHQVAWFSKVDALKKFRSTHGHCNVPTYYQEDKLGTWVKCQRRQHKLFLEGKPSAMNSERFVELDKLGFLWEIRNSSRRSTVANAAA